MMRMYEARQHKERHSRTLQLLKRVNDEHLTSACATEFCHAYRKGGIAQRYPVVGGGPKDEDFLNDVLSLKILPNKHVIIHNSSKEDLYIISFDSYQCQIHIHENNDSDEICGHIKSNGNFQLRHAINPTLARIYLENLSWVIPFRRDFKSWKEFRGYWDEPYSRSMNKILYEEYKEYNPY